MTSNSRFVLLASSIVAIMLVGITTVAAQGISTPTVPAVQIIPHFEEGFVGVLYPYQRYSVDLVLGGRNRFTFL